MEIQFIIFLIIAVIISYLLGFFIGLRRAISNIMNGVVGARMTYEDMDSDEIASITYYYSENLFNEERDRDQKMAEEAGEQCEVLKDE